MKKLLLISGLFFSLHSQAQLTISTGLDTTSMSSLLEGLGVDIHNLTINCAPGAYGQFSGTSEIPISNGLVFSTGDAVQLGAANTNTALTTAWGTPGDPDLDNLAMVTTYDACILEFDAIPVGDTLFFNFAFGSEEYMEWVAGGFNDVFAIWISGPGFAGPTNIAVLPNDTIVSVVNVNTNVNSQYYIDNETVPGMYMELDGFTTNIEVEAVVVPSSTYHFKIGIADAMDEIVDSGVMLEAFSFRSMMEALSVDEPILELNLYPNPAGDFARLQFNENQADIYILNSLGEIMFTQSDFNSGDILNTSALSSGSYFVKVQSGNKTTVQPLMIVK